MLAQRRAIAVGGRAEWESVELRGSQLLRLNFRSDCFSDSLDACGARHRSQANRCGTSIGSGVMRVSGQVPRSQTKLRFHVDRDDAWFVRLHGNRLAWSGLADRLDGDSRVCRRSRDLDFY